jgi:hypothetical protein
MATGYQLPIRVGSLYLNVLSPCFTHPRERYLCVTLKDPSFRRFKVTYCCYRAGEGIRTPDRLITNSRRRQNWDTKLGHICPIQSSTYVAPALVPTSSIWLQRSLFVFINNAVKTLSYTLPSLMHLH